MKTFKHIELMVAVMIMSLGLLFCEKKNLGAEADDPASILGEGKWKVSYFDEDGRNETYYFSGYRFVFNSNGSVEATSDEGPELKGSWLEKTESDPGKLILNFGGASPFDELNDDWEVLQVSPTKLVMEDVSGGSGGTDHLILEKL